MTNEEKHHQIELRTEKLMADGTLLIQLRAVIDKGRVKWSVTLVDEKGLTEADTDELYDDTALAAAHGERMLERRAAEIAEEHYRDY